jgi:hypothetical protein
LWARDGAETALSLPTKGGIPFSIQNPSYLLGERKMFTYVPIISGVVLISLVLLFVVTFKRDNKQFNNESDNDTIEWAKQLHEINEKEKTIDTGSILAPDLLEMRQKVDAAVKEFTTTIDDILDKWRENTWRPVTS